MLVKNFHALYLLFFKTYVFKLKPYFCFEVTKKMPKQFTFLSKIILYQFCAKKLIRFSFRQVTLYNILLFQIFLQSPDKGNRKQSYFTPKIVFIVASIHGIFFYSWHLYIQRKTTKKLKFELLCLFYVLYESYLLMGFKESRVLFFSL